MKTKPRDPKYIQHAGHWSGGSPPEWIDTTPETALVNAMKRRSGRLLSRFRPVTEPDKKREAKKRGTYYEDK